MGAGIVSAGAWGIGYNYALSNKVSIGVNLSASLLQLALVQTVNANYHFGSTFKRGWMIGVDIGRVDRLGGFIDNDSNAIVFISGGFRF